MYRETPYSSDEQRVAAYLMELTNNQVGAGDDPIGFLLAHTEHLRAQVARMKALHVHCEQFIRSHNITCEETVYQSDRVILNAYEFIEGVCDIVGYVDPEEE